MADPALHYQIIGSMGEFGDFEKISGGEPSVAFTPWTQAGARTATNIPGTHSYSDITLERAYDPARDSLLRNWFNLYKNGLETGRSVTKRTQNPFGLVVDTFTYPTCKPSSVKMPDGTAGDASLAMVTVTLKVDTEI